jgi:diguanylate cyclase (GGDEF)-like protein
MQKRLFWLALVGAAAASLPIVLRSHAGALVVLSAGALLLYLRGRKTAQGLAASEARASHLAYHDALTGLPNRAQLADRLARSKHVLRRTGRAFAVLCVDLDRFKEVNDSFGHPAGDELIQIVARSLRAACRETDFLARVGGDEFIVIQDEATPETAGLLADRIVKVLSEPILLQAGQAHIGASIGIVLANEAAQEPQEWLRRADLALYRAKNAGRGQFAFFEPEMDAAMRTRHALQADLREALANDDLELVYQPQVDGKGQIAGVEALVRWVHPEHGPVSPTAFVRLAVESGLIEALGAFTLRRAFRDSVQWCDLRVSINLSAAQFRQKDFLDRLERLVVEAGVTPSSFELEITEALLLGDDPRTNATLLRLREMGFTIALDDFGQGYSSLSSLQRHPIDKIKIDRSIVAQLGADHRAEAVVSAIVQLARALGLSVVAEGVETRAQRDHLLSAGCADVQGYLTGKPMPAREIASFVARRLPWESGRTRPAKDQTPHAVALPQLRGAHARSLRASALFKRASE